MPNPLPPATPSAEALWKLLTPLYPVLAHLPASAAAEARAGLVRVPLAAGTVVFDEHQACRGFPLVLEGSLRVVKSSASGRELTLYRVAAGDTCIVTTSCLVGASAYCARGVAECDSQIALVPAAVFESLLRVEEFRRYVFSLFAARISSLMELVNAVAFQRLDARLAALLLRQPRWQVSHQRIADELGSVREIISRLLKSFADQGMVELGRGQVQVLDAAALSRIAAHDA